MVLCVQLVFIVASQNRIREWPGLEGTLKITSFYIKPNVKNETGFAVQFYSTVLSVIKKSLLLQCRTRKNLHDNMRIAFLPLIPKSQEQSDPPVDPFTLLCCCC